MDVSKLTGSIEFGNNVVVDVSFLGLEEEEDADDDGSNNSCISNCGNNVVGICGEAEEDGVVLDESSTISCGMCFVS